MSAEHFVSVIDVGDAACRRVTDVR